MRTAQRAQREVESALASRLHRDSTGAFFRYLTAEPHAAGTARNRHLAEWIAERYRAYGLEDVKLHKYDVLLPWPTRVSVTMTAPTHYEASLKEDVVDVDPDTRLDPGPTYFGMSGSGDVTGELIYASSGTWGISSANGWIAQTLLPSGKRCSSRRPAASKSSYVKSLVGYLTPASSKSFLL